MTKRILVPLLAIALAFSFGVVSTAVAAPESVKQNKDEVKGQQSKSGFVQSSRVLKSTTVKMKKHKSAKYLVY